ncbi:MAG: S-layer homology domain-containing protein, partial [Firmicutes bacterium]|nr:S-layer homology domain-containing protein [Bacillota bacterium]
MIRKLFSIVILVLILMALSGSAVFADIEKGNVYIMAEELNQLGLLKGVSKGNYDMTRAPTRAESVVMVIRLLGKENDALKYQAAVNPFDDVPNWVEKYISYAYENGLTKGVSEKVFGPNLPVDSRQYITFLLRALNYCDDEGDFSYDEVMDFAAS